MQSRGGEERASQQRFTEGVVSSTNTLSGAQCVTNPLYKNSKVASDRPNTARSVAAQQQGVPASENYSSDHFNSILTQSRSSDERQPSSIQNREEFLRQSTYEDQMVAPFMQSIRGRRLNDEETQQQVQQQLSSLYDFFKQLYSQDRKEISRLRSELRDKDALAQRIMSQGKREGGPRKGDPSGTSSALDGKRSNAPSTSAAGSHSVNVLFLPPHLHPSRPLWRFYATFVASWRNSKTTWLAVLWITLFLMAIGLLVGLLVPWHKTLKLDFTTLPIILAPGPTSVTALFSLSRGSTFYYAVIPAAMTDFNISSTISGRRLLSSPALSLDKVASSDLINLFEAGSDSLLATSTVACGRVLYTNTNFNYTLTINSQASLSSTSECVQAFHVSNVTGLASMAGSAESAPFTNGRCQRCGLLIPNTLYVLLMVAEDGRRTDLLLRHFLTGKQ